jgi:hypothetical protein
VKRLLVVGLIVVALAACSSSNKTAKSTPPPTGTPTTTGKATGWAAAQLATVQQLADTMRAKGLQCDGYTPIDYKTGVLENTNGGLPVPDAEAQCTGDGGENVTFYAFSGEGPAYAWMGTKIRVICNTAAKNNLAPPTFPYVASLTWFIQPDSIGLGDRIAPLFPHSVSREASCQTG